jgi:BolA protein
MSSDRVDTIERILQEALTPDELRIKDQSHLHAGHQGAQDGQGHFDVMIVSAVFLGRRTLERHRLVYDALSNLMETDIHALRIRAYAPGEQ